MKVDHNLNIELTEFEYREFEQSEQIDLALEELWIGHAKFFDISFPTRATDFKWRLRPLGIVGQLELKSGWTIWIQPKCEIFSVLRMIFVAYGDGFQDFGDYGKFDRNAGVVELLAKELNRLVHLRLMHGIHLTYESRDERLTNIRGRIDYQRYLRRAWQTSVDCRYQVLTSDNEDNRIALWGLDRILSSRELGGAVKEESRRLRRKLAGNVSATSDPRILYRRQYTSANEDYRLIHQLARYFITNTSPSDKRGDQPSRLFVVNMAELFEDFLLAVLQKHSNHNYSFRPVVKQIDSQFGIEFRMDVVSFFNGKPIAVIDAKYKANILPSASDIQQVVAYAVSIGVHNAFLVYPSGVVEAIDILVGSIRIRSIVLDISDPSDDAIASLLDMVTTI
jgi:5-methylcytosine-specific restriction enzyme subunit McrC